MTTALSKPTAAETQLKGWLNSDKFKSEIDRMLPAHLKSERFIRIALNAAISTPKLAECTKVSVFKCLLDLAALGIEPNGRDAHLIPYRDNRAGVTTCTLIVDFKGLVQIVKRAPGVTSVHADVIRENDAFEFQQGAGAFLRHSFPLADRGEIVGAYSHVGTTRGESFVVLTLDEIETVRKSSRSGNAGPWKTHFAEMAKKTAFRRHTKWLELPSEVSTAIERLDPPAPAPAPRFPDSNAETIDLAPRTQQIAAGDPDPTAFAPESGAEPAEVQRTRRKPAKSARSRTESPPEPPQPRKAREYTENDAAALRDEFWSILTEAGASFSDFQDWAEKTGMLPDAGALSGVEDLPLSDLARCVNARAGLVSQLQARAKGEE